MYYKFTIEKFYDDGDIDVAMTRASYDETDDNHAHTLYELIADMMPRAESVICDMVLSNLEQIAGENQGEYEHWSGYVEARKRLQDAAVALLDGWAEHDRQLNKIEPRRMD